MEIDSLLFYPVIRYSYPWTENYEIARSFTEHHLYGITACNTLYKTPFTGAHYDEVISFVGSLYGDFSCNVSVSCSLLMIYLVSSEAFGKFSHIFGDAFLSLGRWQMYFAME